MLHNFKTPFCIPSSKCFFRDNSTLTSYRLFQMLLPRCLGHNFRCIHRIISLFEEMQHLYIVVNIWGDEQNYKSPVVQVVQRVNCPKRLMWQFCISGTWSNYNFFVYVQDIETIGLWCLWINTIEPDKWGAFFYSCVSLEQ